MKTQRLPTSERRAELVDTALHIIATKGIAALSTRAITDALNLSSGALFRHFSSMDELLVAVTERVETLMDSTFPPPWLPPLERLERFIEMRSVAVGEQLGVFRLMVSEQFQLALPPEASVRLAGCVQKTRSFVAQALKEGQEQGEIRADLPSEALLMVVLGTMQLLAFSNSHSLPLDVGGKAIRRTLRVLLTTPGQPIDSDSSSPSGPHSGSGLTGPS